MDEWRQPVNKFPLAALHEISDWVSSVVPRKRKKNIINFNPQQKPFCTRTTVIFWKCNLQLWGFISVLSTIVAADAGWGDMHFGIPSCPRTVSLPFCIFPFPFTSSTEGARASVLTTPSAVEVPFVTISRGRLRHCCPWRTASIAPYHCQVAAVTFPACIPLIVGGPLSSWK